MPPRPQTEPARSVRAELTRKRIIRAGEKLFSRNGIESTSLRMVATAAGQANVAAVQYHFGSKEGLITAIFEDRVSEMEEPRRRMLEKIGDITKANLQQLCEIVFLPYLDLVDEDGNHVYARVLLDYLTRYGRFMIPHPARDADTTLIINKALREFERRLPISDLFDVNVEYSMLVTGFLGVLNDHDLRREHGLPVDPIEDLAHDMIAFMVRSMEFQIAASSESGTP